ncbi:MAG: hypothetical protein U0842_25760 [Candidatus Binatia bacterium]
MLLRLLGELPELTPTLTIRVSGRGWGISRYRAFRKLLCDELARAQVPYVLITSMSPYPHDAGVARGARRRTVISAIRAAARRAGVTLATTDYAVSDIDHPGKWITYLTKAEEVIGAAPPRYRVCTMSQSFLPLGLTDARELNWLLLATAPRPRGYKPSSSTRQRVIEGLLRREHPLDSAALQEWRDRMIRLLRTA